MKRLTLCLIILSIALCGCVQTDISQTSLPAQTTQPVQTEHTHADTDNNGLCDGCTESVLVTVDVYAINDLHGKILDTDSQPGVDGLSTYLNNAWQTQENMILLSVGDMWQGSPESNQTDGLLMTEWMNEMGFHAMTMGNHEYDWGEDVIRENYGLAQFPFLAINIYNRNTDTLVDYCQSSVTVSVGGVQVGIIGAIGDCYSSIASERVQDVYFITGDGLTELVKAESEKLRSEGADFIIYVLHDGYDESGAASAEYVRSSEISFYYDTALSDGYVDLVFEGHTHQRYLLIDEYGVFHLQNKGENKGIMHVEFSVNTANGETAVNATELVTNGAYAVLESDPVVDELVEKYGDVIAPAFETVGFNGQERQRNTLRQKVADLYYEAGLERWGDEYDIVLGGGYISVRSPGSLSAGEVTYGQLQTLFPFDNELVLCAVSGSDLLTRFVYTDNSNYFIGYDASFDFSTINPNETYYLITDTYSSTYGPNNLTEIERYGEAVYARDLLADFLGTGAWE